MILKSLRKDSFSKIAHHCLSTCWSWDNLPCSPTDSGKILEMMLIINPDGANPNWWHAVHIFQTFSSQSQWYLSELSISLKLKNNPKWNKRKSSSTTFELLNKDRMQKGKWVSTEIIFSLNNGMMDLPQILKLYWWWNHYNNPVWKMIHTWL